MKLVLVSHGSFAVGLLESFHMIAGENKDISAICLTDEGISDFSKRLKDYLESWSNEQIVVLCDIKGGTPFNEAYGSYLADPERIKIITGMNLPMLIEMGIAMQRGIDFEQIFEIGLNTGTASIEGSSIENNEDNEIDF
jgi:PTS system mannose-specific IIA component